uniref:Germacrene C/D synthase n=1 Tax=Valeriana officinalis TaxID=19953 RepID=TPS1_VALOF|nr:RecName: Full=Germacrene C/D synthase; AltName: Full=Terpene synthase 1; Short=VoTPS1 [Valeriana officinalis]AFR42417.1 germacrene B/C/D synthase [Valeriana officinalis]
MESCLSVSSAPPPKKNIQEPVRPNANFHKSVWGDHFLKYASNPEQINDGVDKQHKQLKEELRKKLVVNVNIERAEEQLKLIDAIQRLGVAYHFRTEIASVLNNQLELWNNKVDDDDLYLTSLRFRLLRQQGYNVSCAVFEKFKNIDGRFNECLTDDVRGLLSLYESTHMRVHKEDILEEALEFTVAQLEQVIKSSLSDKVLLSQVVHALNIPIRKSLTRLEARYFISVYEQDKSCNETLLKFSKLDFNILQKLHQQEVADLTLWWKNLNVSEKVPYARDRLVECYFWALAEYFEPQYSRARKMSGKITALISLIDDTYDSYGTFEELALFTDAAQRWDINAIDQLPEYMRPIFRELIYLYNAMEEELLNDGISYRVEYAKQSVIQMITAYNDEAIWYHNNYVPTFEEYLKVALVSSGYRMLPTNSFVGMGKTEVPHQAFDWVSNNPLMVKASTIIARLDNDKVGHEHEQDRGHVASGVECYMKQHGATKEEAVVEFNKRISSAWKDINQECLHPLPVPMHLLERVLNLVRFVTLFYKNGDMYTNSNTHMKEFISSLLVESIPS